MIGRTNAVIAAGTESAAINAASDDESSDNE